MTSKYKKVKYGTKFRSKVKQIKVKQTVASNENDPQWKTTSKYNKWNISASTGWILSGFYLTQRTPNRSTESGKVLLHLGFWEHNFPFHLRRVELKSKFLAQKLKWLISLACSNCPLVMHYIFLLKIFSPVLWHHPVNI